MQRHKPLLLPDDFQENYLTAKKEFAHKYSRYKYMKCVDYHVFTHFSHIISGIIYIFLMLIRCTETDYTRHIFKELLKASGTNLETHVGIRH